MGQQVAVLVNRAALYQQVATPEESEGRIETGRTINGHQGGPLRTTLIEISKELSPCCAILPSHGPHDQEDFCPSAHTLLTSPSNRERNTLCKGAAY